MNYINDLHTLSLDEIITLILNRTIRYKVHYGLRTIGLSENKEVILGFDIVNLCNSIGLDVSDVIGELLSKNKVIDFTTFWIGGRLLGWERITLFNKIEQILEDHYKKSEKDTILQKLRYTFKI